mgnify:CR=1 FL=1
MKKIKLFNFIFITIAIYIIVDNIPLLLSSVIIYIVKFINDPKFLYKLYYFSKDIYYFILRGYYKIALIFIFCITEIIIAKVYINLLYISKPFYIKDNYQKYSYYRCSFNNFKLLKINKFNDRSKKFIEFSIYAILILFIINLLRLLLIYNNVSTNLLSDNSSKIHIASDTFISTILFTPIIEEWYFRVKFDEYFSEIKYSSQWILFNSIFFSIGHFNLFVSNLYKISNVSFLEDLSQIVNIFLGSYFLISLSYYIFHSYIFNIFIHSILNAFAIFFYNYFDFYLLNQKLVKVIINNSIYLNFSLIIITIIICLLRGIFYKISKIQDITYFI